MQITAEFPDHILPIGTKVFVPRPAINDVHEDEITGYYCAARNIDGKLHIHPTDYQLSLINLSRDGVSNGWKANEFFLSYEEAKTNAVEYNIVATPEEWFRSIGLNGSEDEDRTQYDDECELAPCCANISAIRDILYDVCLTGKINGVTRNSIIQLMEGHEPMTNSYPNLTKILSQMKVTWIDDEPDKAA